jgi:hypothetical protein
MTDEIDIPASALVPKPWFTDRPGDQIVQEIKAFIKRTGKPFLWRGATHTKPPADAEIIYIGETSLPKSHWAPERWSPCPCCRPTKPKFYKVVMIGWFPFEQVIRILGERCFAKINSQGHHIALQAFRREEQQKKDIAYLLEHLGLVGEMIPTVEAAVPAVRALDAVRKTLRERLPRILKTDLWLQIRDGVLTVETEKEESYRKSDGTMGTRTVRREEIYGPIEGQIMLKPDAKPLAPRLAQTLAALHTLNMGTNYATRIHELTDEDRRKTAKVLGQCLSYTARTFREVEEARKFFSRATVGSLNGWNKREGCPIHIFVMVDGRDVYVGRNEHEHQRLTLPKEFTQVLGTLPRISNIDLAAE